MARAGEEWEIMPGWNHGCAAWSKKAQEEMHKPAPSSPHETGIGVFRGAIHKP